MVGVVVVVAVAVEEVRRRLVREVGERLMPFVDRIEVRWVSGGEMVLG